MEPGSIRVMSAPEEQINDALRSARHAQAAAAEALVRAERAVGEARLAEAANEAAIEVLIDVVDVDATPKA